MKDIEGFPNYAIREDGVVWNKRKNQPVPVQRNTFVGLVNEKGRTSSYSARKLYIEYFEKDKPLAEFEGVEHKPMLRYQGIYQIYSNGMVWSLIKHKWMTACSVHQGYLIYCLTDADNVNRTEYVHRLLAENFIINDIIEGFEVHHKDHNKLNNSLDNLQILTPLEHKDFHRKKVISPQVQAKRQQRRRQREEANKHKKHLSQQHKQKIRQALHKYWTEKRGEA